MSQEKINEDELKFVTNGILSRDTYAALTDLSMRKSVLTKVLAIVYLVLIVCGIWSVVHRIWGYLALCGGGILIFSIVLILNRNRSINISIRRAREVYGTGELEILTGFTEDVAYLEHKQVDTCFGIAYSDLSCMYETPRYIFLITKGMQFLTVFKDCLTDAERAALIDFLGEKGVRKK